MRLVALLGLTLGLAACERPDAPSAPSAPRPALEVRFARPERGEVQRRIRATGTLFGAEQATISAKVAGRIDALYRDVGDVVAPGEPLARVEPRDYELALAERQRSFDGALARLGLEHLPEADFDVDALPAVERMRLQAENARARFERGELLHKRTPPAVSDQDYADLRTSYDVAQADQRLAQLAARSQLAEARTLLAQFDTAQQRLADCVHRAPTGELPVRAGESGTRDSRQYAITRRRVSVGDFVQSGAPLYELVDPDPMKLRVPIPEREGARIVLGQRASVTTDAYPEAFDGRISRITPAVDVRTRTFEVEILVANPERKLRAGSFGRAEIDVEREPDVLLIPASAVTVFAGVRKVFVVRDGIASEAVLTLGEQVGERLEVVRGLKGDETLVAAPPAGLTGGTPVREARAVPASGAVR